LFHFLDFWNKSLDGKLHSVRVTNAGPLYSGSFNYADFYGRIH
jgi:uncharacterized protein Usg